MNDMRVSLFSDGGARGNPGPAGIGFVLTGVGDSPISYGEYIGQATNNQAEYRAVKAGLERALQEKVRRLDCFLDSELVVRQLNGEYRVKNGDLHNLFSQVEVLIERFEAITFTHVRREKNKEADRLVNKAIDQALGIKKRKPPAV